MPCLGLKDEFTDFPGPTNWLDQLAQRGVSRRSELPSLEEHFSILPLSSSSQLGPEETEALHNRLVSNWVLVGSRT